LSPSECNNFSISEQNAAMRLKQTGARSNFLFAALALLQISKCGIELKAK